MAAVGLHVTAQRCYLMRNSTRNHGNRAMFDARWNGAKTCRRGDFDNIFGQSIGRNVNVTNSHANNGVAHASAHEKRAMAGRKQSSHQSLRSCSIQPSTRHLHGPNLSASPRRIRAVAPQI